MMKKVLIIAIISVISAYLLVKLIPNNLQEDSVPPLDFSNQITNEEEKVDDNKLEDNVKEEIVIENEDSLIEETVGEEQTKEVVQKDKQEIKKNESNDKKETNKQIEEKTAKQEQENKEQKEDEFYDTSDRDPFAEEQHKSDVPLVLIDKDGNQMEPETVYWDEESNRGTLDPSGYIPEGLPPGAVFVCEVDDDELERIKEEFGVE